jgi:hypothetical protein
MLDIKLFMFSIFYQVQCTLSYIENDSEIFPAHYTQKVAEKGFKIAFMMNKLEWLILVKLFLKIKIKIYQKSLWNSGAHYIHTYIILDEIPYLLLKGQVSEERRRLTFIRNF